MTTTTPNIVVITCHDMGRHVGCYDQPTLQTPNLDALAADGVRFDQAYCAAPQCSPSRAALYTGRWPHANGVLGLTHARFGWDLHPTERHLDDAATAQRLGMELLVRPRRGDEISDAALAWLERTAAEPRPFYLQLGYNEPHRLSRTDPEAEPDYMGFLGDYVEPDLERGIAIPPWLRDTPGARAEMAEIQGAVRYVDRAIGRVFDGLRRLGVEENTIVVFTPDHGLALPRAKCSLYGPGLEVALIVRWPAGGWTGGRVESALVSNVDVFPTLLEALGIDPPPGVHGQSFRALLDRTPWTARESITAEMTYHDYYDPRRAIRTATHHLIVNFTAAPSFMNPSQSWRPRSDPLVPARPALDYHPLVELFDLRADPHERVNLAGREDAAAVQTDLLARLHAWMRQTDDPLLAGAVTPPMHRWALEALAGGTMPATETPPVA